MDFLSIEDVTKLATVVLGFIVALYKFLKISYEFLKKQYERITSLHNKVDVIFKEVTPNGGCSIKDKNQVIIVEELNSENEVNSINNNNEDNHNNNEE